MYTEMQNNNSLFIFISNSSNIITTSFHKNSSGAENHFECPICCHSISLNELKEMPCCSVKLCSSCLLTYTITNIANAKLKIECPACSQDINSSTILYNSELPVSIRERYQQILAQDLSEKQNTFIKLCPHCNFITILDENALVIREKKFRRSSQEWIRCEQCDKEWCWSCYAPSHPNETCRHFKKNHSQLDIWARTRRSDKNNQRNAQRCPKCSIYIEKIDGCDHMMCGKCNSKFCYRCGSKMRLPFYVGHDAKYSIFGCKYKLWPNRPLLRWLTRGSIFVSVILLTPVVLAALIALIAIGIPTVLIVGCLALPVFLCLECKRRS
jgi:E3 ubiquitin-protein ligase RNF217